MEKENLAQLKRNYNKETNLFELDKKYMSLVNDSKKFKEQLAIKNLLSKEETKATLKKLKLKLNEANKIKIIIKKLIKKQEKSEKKKIRKPKKEFDFLWIVLTFLFGISTIGLLFSMMIFETPDLIWLGVAFTFGLICIMLFIFLIFLGKKTHAVLEFKALLSGKPLCLFFTDHKRVDWKVIDPEAGVINDKIYGSFLVNEKGSYVDNKTRNILMAFNPSVATNAPIEAFNLTDGLAKVFKDEKSLSQIRFALANGEIDEDDCISINGEKLEPFTKIKESIDFSFLKSLMNTILPHNINSKIEMQVAQRIGGVGKINPMQAAIIFVSIIGAVVLAVILLKMYGGNGTQTVVRETVRTVAQNASNVING